MKIKMVGIILGSIFLFFVFPTPTHAVESGINLNLGVTSCNINGICEPHLGENIFTCPSECLAPVSGFYPANISVFFRNVLVTVFTDRVIITWESSLPTIDTVKWGKTIDFNDGSLRGLVYTKNHRIEITDLSPDTFYYAHLMSHDASNRTVEYGIIPFITLPAPGAIPNPTHVRTEVIPSGIFLSWQNPTHKDFEYIRILKNTWAYPLDPFSGTLVYEGPAQSFLDQGVEKDQKYFYALFSRGKNGNFSSGVFISAIFAFPSGISALIDLDEETFTAKRRVPIWIEKTELIPSAIAGFFSLLWKWIIQLLTTICNFFKELWLLIKSLF